MVSRAPCWLVLRTPSVQYVVHRFGAWNQEFEQAVVRTFCAVGPCSLKLLERSGSSIRSSRSVARCAPFDILHISHSTPSSQQGSFVLRIARFEAVWELEELQEAQPYALLLSTASGRG